MDLLSDICESNPLLIVSYYMACRVDKSYLHRVSCLFISLGCIIIRENKMIVWCVEPYSTSWVPRSAT